LFRHRGYGRTADQNFVDDSIMHVFYVGWREFARIVW